MIIYLNTLRKRYQYHIIHLQFELHLLCIIKENIKLVFLYFSAMDQENILFPDMATKLTGANCDVLKSNKCFCLQNFLTFILIILKSIWGGGQLEETKIKNHEAALKRRRP